MQEEEQRRYHEMKMARNHHESQAYEQLEQEPMTPQHTGSDRRAQKTVQPVPKLEVPQEIVLPEDVTVVQLASLLGALVPTPAAWPLSDLFVHIDSLLANRVASCLQVLG